MRLVLVFDQFNAIAKQGESVWGLYSWSIPLRGVPGATVITSSSANNEALAKVPETTVRIGFWSPFDANEYLVWKQKFVSIGDWDDADALAFTRYVPLFLYELLEAVVDSNNYSDGRQAYVNKFLDDTSQLHTMFISKQILNFLGSIDDAHLFETALVSNVPLTKRFGKLAMVNRQFSYVKYEGGAKVIPVMALLARFSRF